MPGRRHSSHLVVDRFPFATVADLIGATGEYRAASRSQKALQLSDVLRSGDRGLNPEEHIYFSRNMGVIVEIEFNDRPFFVEEGR